MIFKAEVIVLRPISVTFCLSDKTESFFLERSHFHWYNQIISSGFPITIEKHVHTVFSLALKKQIIVRVLFPMHC